MAVQIRIAHAQPQFTRKSIHLPCLSRTFHKRYRVRCGIKSLWSEAAARLEAHLFSHEIVCHYIRFIQLEGGWRRVCEEIYTENEGEGDERIYSRVLFSCLHSGVYVYLCPPASISTIY